MLLARIRAWVIAASNPPGDDDGDRQDSNAYRPCRLVPRGRTNVVGSGIDWNSAREAFASPQLRTSVVFMLAGLPPRLPRAR
jgi:hypothetical protein